MQPKVVALLLAVLVVGSTIGYASSAYIVYQPQIDKLNADLSTTKNELSSTQIEKAALEVNYTMLQGEYAGLQDNYTLLAKDYNQLNSNYSNLRVDYVTLSHNYSQLTTNYEQLNNSYSSLSVSYSQLNSNYNDLNAKYTALNTAYIQLQGSQGTLSAQYAALQSSYNQLSTSYTQLQTDYSEETTLRIGTTLETYYDYVRANLLAFGVNPLGEERWDLHPSYYNISVEFAADEAAHDAGNAYWPSMEKGSGYYDITGEHAYTTANNIMEQAITYSGIKATDSSVDKIDKILGFIQSRVTYQSRLLDHMWFPTETLTFKSGDCTSFSILAACMFEEVGIKSAIGFFTNSTLGGHAMVLVRLDNLGGYGYRYYSDLTSFGLTSGKWIIIEPQFSSVSVYSNNLNWVSYWSIVAANEVPYGA